MKRAERRAIRQKTALERAELRNKRTDAEQLARLDAGNYGASKERKKL